MPGQGASDGDISVIRVRGARASLRAAWRGSVQPTGAPERCAVRFGRIDHDRPSRSGLPHPPSPRGGLRDKWHGVQRRLDDEMVQLALCEGDRERLRVSGRAAIPRHRRRRQAPRRPRPARRDQSRDQSRHQADERPRPIWPDRRLDFAARDAAAAAATAKITRSRNSWRCAAPASRPTTCGS